MTCNEYHEKIDLYLDEALTASERTAFESHVHGCPSCTEALEQARVLLHVFWEMPSLACPERVVHGIFAQSGIDQYTPATGRSFGKALQELLRLLLPRPALAGWLLMMFVVISSYFLSRQPTRVEPAHYTVAELQQARSQLDHAFTLFFTAVRKSEKFTRNEVLVAKIILPVQAGLRQVYEPLSVKGAL